MTKEELNKTTSNELQKRESDYDSAFQSIEKTKEGELLAPSEATFLFEYSHFANIYRTYHQEVNGEDTFFVAGVSTGISGTDSEAEVRRLDDLEDLMKLFKRNTDHINSPEPRKLFVELFGGLSS